MAAITPAFDKFAEADEADWDTLKCLLQNHGMLTISDIEQESFVDSNTDERNTEDATNKREIGCIVEPYVSNMCGLVPTFINLAT